MKKLVYNAFITLSLLFLAWAFFSFLDIVADNCTAAPVHSVYNLFML